eukprot:4927130-Amphidinium_carterae.1
MENTPQETPQIIEFVQKWVCKVSSLLTLNYKSCLNGFGIIIYTGVVCILSSEQGRNHKHTHTHTHTRAHGLMGACPAHQSREAYREIGHQNMLKAGAG